MLNQAAKEHSHIAVGHISFDFEITAITPEVLTVQRTVKLLNMWLLQCSTGLLHLGESQIRGNEFNFVSDLWRAFVYGVLTQRGSVVVVCT